MSTTAAWAPPELSLTPTSPFAFDVYAAALVWLRGTMHTLTSSRQMDEFRCALTAQPADGVSGWLETTCDAEVECNVSHAAWQVVGKLLEARPEDRISAFEALHSSYLSEATRMVPT